MQLYRILQEISLLQRISFSVCTNTKNFINVSNRSDLCCCHANINDWIAYLQKMFTYLHKNSACLLFYQFTILIEFHKLWKRLRNVPLNRKNLPFKFRIVSNSLHFDKFISRLKPRKLYFFWGRSTNHISSCQHFFWLSHPRRSYYERKI